MHWHVWTLLCANCVSSQATSGTNAHSHVTSNQIVAPRPQLLTPQNRLISLLQKASQTECVKPRFSVVIKWRRVQGERKIALNKRIWRKCGKRTTALQFTEDDGDSFETASSEEEEFDSQNRRHATSKLLAHWNKKEKQNETEAVENQEKEGQKNEQTGSRYNIHV